MIQNFDTAKKQLVELADILNKFKSEAVQLRIVELLLGDVDEPQADETPIRTKTRRKRKAISKKADDKPAPKKKKSSSSSGAHATLSRLYGEDFFSSPRTISDICAHAKNNLAVTIKPNEISGKLARMIRNNELKRAKNSDNQFEYSNP